MSLSFESLEREDLIRRLPVDKRKVRDTIGLARRDINLSKKLLEEDADWAFSIAYNSMLQATRALMFAKGFRPHGKSHHLSAIRFAEIALGREETTAFDAMRRKRHRAVYDTAGSISDTEANNAVRRAEELVKKIETILENEDFL